MEKRTPIAKTQAAEYEDKLYNYVSEELERFSSIRDHKETVTYTGFAIFLSACFQMLFTAT